MTERVFQLPKSRSRHLLAAAALAALAAGCAKSAPQGTTAQLATYEVVSIKPHQANANGSIWEWRTADDGFSASGVALKNLIMNAYGLTMPSQISGLPGWADSDGFDIEAKMDEDTTAALKKLPKEERVRQNGLMMQSLLADRFQLKIHHETKALPVYDLAIAKGGLKMKKAPADEPEGYSVGSGRLEGKSVPIDSFMGSLAYEVGRLVVNKTGLTGSYSITLKWTPDGEQETADSGPSIFAAIKEQLGLKLVPAKGPVDTIVVDRVEKPSPN